MKLSKRFLSLCLMLCILAGLMLPSHALGYRLSGTVTSYGAGAEGICLLLTPEGEDTPAYEVFTTAADPSYRMENLQSGNYTLTVSKEGHVTRHCNVTLDASDVVLDVKICFLGDVTGDGRVNVGDVSVVYAHCKATALLTDPYKLACADYNGNGKVNVADTGSVYSVIKGTNRPAVKKETLSVWAPSADFGENSWLLRMEDAFQKAHPEYQITWDNDMYLEGDAGYAVATDPQTAADVYMFANDQLGMLVNSNAILPLEGEYLEQVLVDNGQAMIHTVTYTDEQVYGFPVSNNTWFMYYNKDVFTDEDVKSLDTMLTKGKVAFPWEVSWYSGSFFLANGGTIFGEKGNDASAGIQFGEDHGGCEAALKMVQLAAHPNMVNDTNGIGAAGLKTGEIGAFFSGSWDANHLKETLGDKLGAVQLPTVEISGEQKQMKAFAGSKAVGVNPYAGNTQLAMSFAAFLATPEAQRLRYEYAGFIPSAKILAQDPVISSDPVAMAEINTVTNTAVVQPFIPEMGNYWTPMGSFGTMIACGEITESNYIPEVDQLMQWLNDFPEDPEVPDVPTEPDEPEDFETLLPPMEGGIPVTLKVWCAYEDYYSWLIKLENQFRNAHPEYSITWENDICYEADAGYAVTRDPQAAADVFLFTNDQLGMLMNANALLPIGGQYLEQVLEDNSQTLVHTVTYSDDRVYGFPVANNTWFMYYNKDIFTEEDVKSLDTMLAKGKVAFSWESAWYGGSFFFANGGTAFGEKGNDPSAGIQFGSSHGGYQTALKMIQLAAHPNMVNDTSGMGADGLRTGEIGAIFSGSWDEPGLREALGDKLGAAQLPTVEIGGEQKQMKAFAGSKAVGVNAYTENTQLATAFAAFLASSEAQKLRYEQRGVIPAAASLADDPDICRNEVALAEILTMSNASVVQPTIPEMANYWGAMGNFGSQLIYGKITQSNYKAMVDRMMEAFQMYL